jgi:hypothetical protein
MQSCYPPLPSHHPLFLFGPPRLQDHPEVRTPIPRREDFPAERGVLLVTYAVHKIKDKFFALVQSEVCVEMCGREGNPGKWAPAPCRLPLVHCSALSMPHPRLFLARPVLALHMPYTCPIRAPYAPHSCPIRAPFVPLTCPDMTRRPHPQVGDVYMVKLDAVAGTVSNISVRYFDTLPTAISLCISKFGMLFAASEFSNQYVGGHAVVAVCSSCARVCGGEGGGGKAAGWWICGTAALFLGLLHVPVRA